MHETETIKEFIAKKTHRFRIKVYKVEVCDRQGVQVWYADKIGQSFYCVLSIKITHEGYAPVFRVVNMSEDLLEVAESALIRDIIPNHCKVLDEFIVRSNRSLRHLIVSEIRRR